MKNTMTIKVWRNDETTGEQKLQRVYPCSEIYSKYDDSSMMCIFNDGTAKYTMEVRIDSWCGEYYTISAI